MLKGNHLQATGGERRGGRLLNEKHPTILFWHVWRSNNVWSTPCEAEHEHRVWIKKTTEARSTRRKISENVSLLQGRRRLVSASSLPDLHVIGREKAVSTPAHASPPALVNHLNVGDDVVGIKGNFIVAGWKGNGSMKEEQQMHFDPFSPFLQMFSATETHQINKKTI